MAKEVSPVRVLIVDDEPLLCWSLAETLHDSGCVTTEAGTGHAALSTLTDEESQGGVDVVLLDYKLPDAHGLDLLAEVRRRSPRSQVVLMTVHGTTELAHDALACGAWRVIEKPIDMNDVPGLVREAAESRTGGMRRERAAHAA